MAYQASIIANYFIFEAEKYRISEIEDEAGFPNNYFLNSLVLQKMVFVAHGYCLAILNRPLVRENPICIKTKNTKKIVFESLEEEFSGYGIDDVLYPVGIPKNRPLTGHPSITVIENFIDFDRNESNLLGGIWASQKEHKHENKFWTLYTLAFLEFEGEIENSIIKNEFLKFVLEIPEGDENESVAGQQTLIPHRESA